MSRPLYIAIEGIKGCGKSSLFKAITRYLVSKGRPHHCLRPTAPVSGHVMEWVYRTLRLEHWDGMMEHLYAFRSNWHASQVPKRSPLILGDRSILTSYATRWPGSGHHGAEQHLDRVDRLEHRIPLPDHILFLDVDVDTALSRIAGRPHRDYGLRDEAPSRLAACINAYRQLKYLAGSLGVEHITWHHIDATQPHPIVLQQGIRILEQLTGALE
ncbi:MAG: hypothetical protein HZB71_11250 [Betaproteobacteria bacterium]|nr:hypothetical protein [Betaproteobacteria bacterium]